MNNKYKYKLAKIICSLLPPIIAPTIRSKIISIEDGEKLALNFTRKSFTGGYFNGNTNDFHAFKFSIHGFFDWRNVMISKVIIEKFIKGDIIEVGANIGTETIGFSDVSNAHNLKTFAYEPLTENVKHIENLKRHNNLSNLNIYQKLVSDYSGMAKFKIPDANQSGSGFISDELGTESFEVIKLDDFHKDNVISLICCDVEGFEYQVLRGATGIIEKNAPFLILEVNKNYLNTRANISLEHFYDFIVSKKYTPYYIKPLGLEKIDIHNYKNLSNKNWLCIPMHAAHAEKAISNKICLSAFNPFLN